jgi:hypothetical protein
MANKEESEALDRVHRDLRAHERSMGSVVILFAGDF